MSQQSKVRIKRPVLVGGYGNTPVAAGSVVAPTTHEEAKELVAQGYAEEVSAKEELTHQPTQPVIGENGHALSGVVDSETGKVEAPKPAKPTKPAGN